MARRPSVQINCVADQYSKGMSSQRIIEFNANDGTGRGGLIEFKVLNDGTFRVEVYRCEGVEVIAPRVAEVGA